MYVYMNTQLYIHAYACACMDTNPCKHTYACAARAPTRTHKHAHPNTRTNWATHACIHIQTNWATHVDFECVLKERSDSLQSLPSSLLTSPAHCKRPPAHFRHNCPRNRTIPSQSGGKVQGIVTLQQDSADGTIGTHLHMHISSDCEMSRQKANLPGDAHQRV